MQTMSSMFDSVPLDFDIPPSLPAVPSSVSASVPAPAAPEPGPAPAPVPAPRQQLNPMPPPTNKITPVPKNPTILNKNMGFSNLPDLPSVPTDIPTGDIKEKNDDEETDFDELLNRFEDLKKNKK